MGPLLPAAIQITAAAASAASSAASSYAAIGQVSLIAGAYFSYLIDSRTGFRFKYDDVNE